MFFLLFIGIFTHTVAQSPPVVSLNPEDPIQDSMFYLTCVADDLCGARLTWYFGNLSSAVTIGCSVTALGQEKGIQLETSGVCDYPSTSNLSMTADAPLHQGTWFCDCDGVNAINVSISDGSITTTGTILPSRGFESTIKSQPPMTTIEGKTTPSPFTPISISSVDTSSAEDTGKKTATTERLSSTPTMSPTITIESSKAGLGVGAILGITIAGIFAVGGIIGLALKGWKTRYPKPDYDSEENGEVVDELKFSNLSKCQANDNQIKEKPSPP